MPVAVEIDLSQIYVPHERQRVFHSCPADIVLYGGAAGGGKSRALLMEAFIQCLETPYNRALLIRRTFPELNRSLIQASLRLFPRELCEYRVGDKEWHFRNGSILEFGYSEQESDIYRYQSAEYGFIGFDELTHFTYEQWDYLVNSRLRSVQPGAWPRVRAATNPGGVGHAWVKELFRIGEMPPDTVWADARGRTWAFIPAKVTDNPYIMENDPEYIERLKSLDPKWRKALLEGDWEVFAGKFFTGLSAEIHRVPFFVPPENWPVYHAMDWGSAKPYSIGLWAVDPNGSLYRFAELYGWGGRPNEGSREPAREVARKLKELEVDLLGERRARSVVGPADPSLWAKSGVAGSSGRAISVIEEFFAEGLIFHKANNDRLNGWEMVRRRLAVDEDGVPGLYVADTCKHWWRTMPMLVHSETRPEDLDTDGEDHCADETRYMCSYPQLRESLRVYDQRDDEGVYGQPPRRRMRSKVTGY